MSCLTCKPVDMTGKGINWDAMTRPRMVCETCDGWTWDDLQMCRVCWNRDSDLWNLPTDALDTCLDWEPAKE